MRTYYWGWIVLAIVVLIVILLLTHVIHFGVSAG
jgi:hypothetical protein